jgi:hypothetical protein
MVAAEPTREAAVSSEPDKGSLPLHPTMPDVRVLQRYSVAWNYEIRTEEIGEEQKQIRISERVSITAGRG